jgi:hypothetical protein
MGENDPVGAYGRHDEDTVDVHAVGAHGLDGV